jgi:L-ribulose-5-phosphate 3-epimerase
MRLSIITDEISQDLKHALDVCHDLGVDTVELRTIEGKNIVFHDEESLSQIKALLQSGGFRVCAISSPFLKCALWSDRKGEEQEGEAEAQEWRSLQSSFEIAKLLGAPLVRTFSFLRVTEPMAVREKVRDVIAEAVRRTEAAGLKLVLENEHACNIATGEEAGWLLNLIRSDALGMIWDPGNEAKLGSRPFPDGYDFVRGRVFHVHLKDADRERHFVKMGTGIIDYINQFRALAADGYDGTLSLETHYAHPEGGLEQASRESFAALRALLRESAITLDP